jgi:hypothetical protein
MGRFTLLAFIRNLYKRGRDYDHRIIRVRLQRFANNPARDAQRLWVDLYLAF